MIVRVSISLRRTKDCDDIESCFDNLRRNHHQSQVNCESLVALLIGRLAIKLKFVTR